MQIRFNSDYTRNRLFLEFIPKKKGCKKHFFFQSLKKKYISLEYFNYSFKFVSGLVVKGRLG